MIGFVLTKLTPAFLLLVCISDPAIARPHVLANVPGGYSPAELTEDVKAAAEFAVAEQARREAVALKLSDISKAEKQIVAGVNYHLDIVVEQSGSARNARVVVFRDLKSRYKLTSWEWR